MWGNLTEFWGLFEREEKNTEEKATTVNNKVTTMSIHKRHNQKERYKLTTNYNFLSF